MDDARLTLDDTVSVNIFHHNWNMKKQSAGRVPRMLMFDQNWNLMMFSSPQLIWEQSNKKIRRSFVTVYETWVYYYNPEIKE